MSDESYDRLRKAVIDALGPRPSPVRRRKVAADLKALAEQQERMAARDEQPSGAGPQRTTRGEERPASPSLAQRAAEERAERVAGTYVRINHEPDPQTGALRVRVSLGKQLWSDAGSPERIDVQRAGNQVWIVPVRGKAGYALSFGGSLPSCVVDPQGPVKDLLPGRYATSLRAGAIVIGVRLT
ncbi:MAG: hypothetical protein RLZZ387_4799 [Chloroflexota bacterium]|jgi:hypothetical protein